MNKGSISLFMKFLVFLTLFSTLSGCTKAEQMDLTETAPAKVEVNQNKTNPPKTVETATRPETSQPTVVNTITPQPKAIFQGSISAKAKLITVGSEFPEPEGLIFDIAFSSNSSLVAVATQSGIAVYRMPNLETVWIAYGIGSMSGIVFTPDDQYIVVGNSDEFEYFRASDGQIVRSVSSPIVGHTSGLFPSGKTMVSIDGFGCVSFTKLETGEVISKTPCHDGGMFTSLTFSDEYVYAGGYSNDSVYVWDENGNLSSKIGVAENLPHEVGLLPNINNLEYYPKLDRLFMLSDPYPGSVYEYNLSSGEFVNKFPPCDTGDESIATMSATVKNDDFLIVAGCGNKMRVFKVYPNHDQVEQFNVQDENIRISNIKISPDNNFIIAWTDSSNRSGNSLYLWDFKGNLISTKDFDVWK